MAWTLRKRILIGYGITLALMAVVLSWALVSLLELSRASDAILRENYKSILAAENMIDAIERQDSAMLLLTLGYTDQGIKQFKDHETHFLQWLARARDNITIQGEAEIVQSIEEGYSRYLVIFTRARDLRQTEPQQVAAFYHETALPAFLAVREGCARLREINQETMFEASKRAGHVGTRAIWSVAIIGAAGIGLGLVFSLLLSDLIVRPLERVMAATQRVAEGHYDTAVPTASSDELGRLAEAFNAMVLKLRSYHDLNIGQIVAEKRKSDAILRSIDDGIVVVDAALRVTSINPTAAHVFGVEPDEAENRHFLEIVKSERLFEYVKQSVESGQAPCIEEGKSLFTVERSGAQHHYQFSITPVRSDAGAMLGVVLVVRDVTRLKELDRLKSEFVMAASHELRTPLTSMGMSIKLLEEEATDKLTEPQRQLVAVAREELERLQALVSDLLDLSRIEAGKMEMAFEAVAIPLVLDRAIAVLKAQAEEKSVELASAVPDGLPAVRADANKVTWVLTNLISNALRYTASGGHIRLSVEQLGAQVHVAVADDGSGIPYEYQSRIFDKFVQVKGDGAAGGSGLGLAICREIVRAHGGMIWVDSTPGEGSTFTLTLPIMGKDKG